MIQRLAEQMGRQPHEVALAVAEAIDGNFEYLKECGVRGKRQDNHIAFTFKGVTSEVANTKEGIEAYIASL